MRERVEAAQAATTGSQGDGITLDALDAWHLGGALMLLEIATIFAGEWYGVDIEHGRPLLEGCDVSSEGLSCVAIYEGADPTLCNNAIHDGAADFFGAFDENFLALRGFQQSDVFDACAPR